MKVLENINWDFADAKTDGVMHAIHPYPAKFIPQIPNKFIKEFTVEGETVYDPFLGSGTTCLESNVLGRNALGNDVNDMSILITKVKTTPIEQTKLNTLDSFLNRLYKKTEDKNTPFDIPEIINLDLWFQGFVIRELSILRNEILQIPDETLRDFCLVAMSAIIVRVSRQDSDTRYVRVEKNIYPNDVFLMFSKQIKKMKKMMIESYSEIGKGETSVKFVDSRIEDIFNENSADLAVTSPPYPNAYDYHLYHKYRLYWLNMNPNELKKMKLAHTHITQKKTV